MNRQHKIWGERWLIRQDSTHNLSLLKVKAGHRCSWHSHRSKSNLFVVLSGKVGVVTEHDEAVLTGGECFTVGPGLLHEFRAYQDSQMIEEMYVEYDESDIDRANVGSKFDIGVIRPNIDHLARHN